MSELQKARETIEERMLQRREGAEIYASALEWCLSLLPPEPELTGIVEPDDAYSEILYPEPEPAEDDGWIEWGGDECPTRCNEFVEVEFMDGAHDCGYAEAYSWCHSAGDYPGNIVRYRVVKREQPTGNSGELTEARVRAIIGEYVAEHEVPQHNGVNARFRITTHYPLVRKEASDG